MKIITVLFFALLVSCSAFSQTYRINYMAFYSQQQELKMGYIYEKAAGTGNKTIVLLHGKNFSCTYWYKTISALLKEGYNVLAPDQIGFGQSSMPANYQYSFHQLATNTKTLIDTLGIKSPVILGHSLGGMLAIRYALMYPENCSRLILEDPIGLEDWQLSIPYTNIDEAYKTELKKDKATLKKYMQDNYFHGEWKILYDMLLNESSKYLGKKEYAWSMALTSDMMFTQPVCYEFEKIKVKTILIIGSLDKTAPGKEKADKAIADSLGDYPVLGKLAASKIPDCKLVIVKGLGHIPHEEDFTQFISIVINSLK